MNSQPFLVSLRWDEPRLSSTGPSTKGSGRSSSEAASLLTQAVLLPTRHRWGVQGVGKVLGEQRWPHTSGLMACAGWELLPACLRGLAKHPRAVFRGER